MTIENIKCPILNEKKSGSILVNFDVNNNPIKIMCEHYISETFVGKGNELSNSCGLREVKVKGEITRYCSCIFSSWKSFPPYNDKQQN